MNIIIAAVGKAKAGPIPELYQNFFKRIPGTVVLKEVEEKKPLPSAQLKEREAQLLLQAIPPQAYVIALDEHGKELGSIEFAKKLQQLQDQGAGPIAFLIGGADGHGEAVLKRAQFRLSLGKMTWPHLLVRVMLAEQLYRAYTISSNHPYHRE